MWTKARYFRTQWRNITRFAKPQIPLLTFVGVSLSLSDPALSADANLRFKRDKHYNVALVNSDEMEEDDGKGNNTPSVPVISDSMPSSKEAPVNWMTAAEMAKLAEEGRVVVAFQGNVYDVTAFTGHPGGYGRLQMASGGDLAVFWSVYTQHNRGHIDYILNRYKIGELDEEQAAIVRENTKFQNPFLDDPQPYPDLLTNTRYPYNAEARLRDLRESWITPIGRHFVRNHSTVPNVDVSEYKLTVCGAGLNETTFSYEDLKTKFPKVDVTTVIQCNGNRREDFHYIDGETPAFGPPHWVAGAISNATWSGVRLRDVLRAAGRVGLYVQCVQRLGWTRLYGM
jgi:cytochrome b involved in lipid metabolism